MGLDMVVILMFFFICSFGIWYIYGGYKYGFIDQKIMRTTLGGSWGKEDNYLYGKDAKKRGSIDILIGIIALCTGGYILYLHFVLGVMKW